MTTARTTKSELVERVVQAAIDFGAATDSVTDGAAGALGINRTDMRVLSLIRIRGPQSVGRLAQLSGLSPAAATTVARRLADAGYVAQDRDPTDARRSVIVLTDLARARLSELYGPMLDQGRSWLTTHTRDRLQLLVDFLEVAEGLQLDLAAGLRAERVRGDR